VNLRSDRPAPTAPASNGQVVRRGTRLVIDIREASLAARLAASVKLAREKAGK
jgi:hypothetical protein